MWAAYLRAKKAAEDAIAGDRPGLDDPAARQPHRRSGRPARSCSPRRRSDRAGHPRRHRRRARRAARRARAPPARCWSCARATPSWTRPAKALPVSEFDVIVVGAGPVGENAADYAAPRRALRGDRRGRAGRRRVLVLGLHPVQGAAAHGPRRRRAAPAAGHHRRLRPGRRCSPAATASPADWDDAGQVEWAEGAGITVLRGRGRLTGEKTVAIDGRATILTARGTPSCSRPAACRSGRRCPGSTTCGSGDPATPPRRRRSRARLGVLGGGVVGCEMAQAFQRLGSQVDAGQPRCRGCSPSTEPFAGERVAAGLRADGRRRAPRPGPGRRRPGTATRSR